MDLPDKRRIVACGAGLLALPFYVACGVSHICICGHLAHGPYPGTAYAIDLGWGLGLSAALVFSLRSNMVRKRMFFVVTFLLTALRALGDDCLAFVLIPLYIAVASDELRSVPAIRLARTLERSWRRTWVGLGGTGRGRRLRTRVIAAYDADERKYHSCTHLAECLTAVEPHLSMAEHPAEVEAALWFHDVVYDTHVGDNEGKSAEWAEKELSRAGVAPERIARIRALILATRHAVPPVGIDQTLVVDADLAILGAPPERFAEYEAQVRQEYAWVDGPVFRSKRVEILQAFLAREHIFGTSAFRDAFEKQARENLEGTVRRLGCVGENAEDRNRAAAR